MPLRCYNDIFVIIIILLLLWHRKTSFLFKKKRAECDVVRTLALTFKLNYDCIIHALGKHRKHVRLSNPFLYLHL